MNIDLIVPQAGESITEGKVASILKVEGAYVKQDEEILEIETDKVNQVIHAPRAGILSLCISLDQVV